MAKELAQDPVDPLVLEPGTLHEADEVSADETSPEEKPYPGMTQEQREREWNQARAEAFYRLRSLKAL